MPYDIHEDVKYAPLEVIDAGALARSCLDVRDPDERTVVLAPRQGMVVPKGVVHRTRAQRRTVVLMVEPATVKSTGD